MASSLFQVYPRFDVEPIRGKGSYVFDEEGNTYLDFYGGHAVISIGHSHPVFVQAICKQVEQLAFYSNSVHMSIQEEYARNLAQHSGYPDYLSFFCNSGAEANENALKLASAHTGRAKVLVFERGFHGRTSLAVECTDNPDIVFPVNRSGNVVRQAWGDIKNTKSALNTREFAAVLIEGIQGVGGVHVADSEFLHALRRSCVATDTVLILDEIQSGFGRSGHFFAHQHAEIQPDLISMAKGMGNGFPIGGVLIHPKFEAKSGLLGTTFGGNPLACAAGNAVLHVIEQEQLIKNAARLGAELMEAASSLPRIKEVRGLGLMIGLEFDFPIADLRKRLLTEHRVFTGSSSQKNVLRLLPPLCIGKQEIDVLLSALEDTLT